MKWLDFEINRSKVKVVVRPNIIFKNLVLGSFCHSALSGVLKSN